MDKLILLLFLLYPAPRQPIPVLEPGTIIQQITTPEKQLRVVSFEDGWYTVDGYYHISEDELSPIGFWMLHLLAGNTIHYTQMFSKEHIDKHFKFVESPSLLP